MNTQTKNPRTTSKEVKAKIQAYVIDCISTDGFPVPDDTLREGLKLVCEEFHSAACYRNNLLRLKTYQEVFIDWLDGLPSCFSIECYKGKKMIYYNEADLRFTGWEHECRIIDRSTNEYYIPIERYYELKKIDVPIDTSAETRRRETIAAMKNEILNIMASFGLPLPENKEPEDGIKLFKYLIFREFVTLCKKNDVNFWSYCTTPS